MGRKRFEKTRSRMVYHAILGLGDFPQQASRWQLLAKGTLLATIISDSESFGVTSQNGRVTSQNGNKGLKF